MYYPYETPSSYTLLRPYLQDGEELLWAGKPFTSVPYRPSFSVLVFSIFWLGFALFWTVGATEADGAFGLFGLPFIGVGCFLFYKQFIGISKQMKKTYYAVTDRRAIILTETRHGVHCTEFAFANMTNVTLTSVRGNVGTILFPAPVSLYVSSRRGVTLQEATVTANHSFLMIDDGQTVYRLISERISEQARR